MKITNDTDQAHILTTQNTRGQESENVRLEAGESATVDLDGENHLVISCEGTPPGKTANQNPIAAKVLAEEQSGVGQGGAGDLKEATDEQVSAVLTQMRTDKTDLTGAGVPNANALNQKLAAQGYRPIDAANRDRLWTALPADTTA